MAIEVHCSECGRVYRVADDKSGKQFRCKDCQTIVSVPDANSGGFDLDDDFESDEWEDSSGGADDFEEENPWSAPQTSGKRSKKQGGRARARQRTQLPAIFLMIIAVISILVAFLALANVVINGPDEAQLPPPGPERDGYIVGYYVGGVGVVALMIVCHIIIMIGANHLRTLGSRGWARTAAILSCIPLCTCLCTGLPFGVWALVVMSDSNVDQAFQT